MSRAPDRDTEALLADLEETLAALRAELDEERRKAGPPTPREVLRFTEEHTIPTVVATLEATIAALELLRGALRLLDPGRSRSDEPRRTIAGTRAGVSAASESAVAGVERALSELRTALAEADLPEDEAARGLLTDARSLTDEVERRLQENRRGTGTADRANRGRREEATGAERGRERPSGGVEIDVTEEGGGEAATDERPADASGVDVESELASIREEVRDESPEDTEE